MGLCFRPFFIRARAPSFFIPESVTAVSNTIPTELDPFLGGAHWRPPNPPPSVFHGFVGLSPCCRHRKSIDFCL